MPKERVSQMEADRKERASWREYQEDKARESKPQGKQQARGRL